MNIHAKEETLPDQNSPGNPVERFPGKYAAESPDRLAVIHGTSGWKQTYRELDDQANRLSTLFRTRGLAVGDHVIIMMENHERFIEAAWGAHYAGLIYTTISTRLTAEETSYIAVDSGARAMICSVKYAEVGAEVRAQLPSGAVCLAVGGTIDGFESYEDLVDARDPTPLPSPRIAGDDMLYSSGTTGRQKAVKRSNRFLPLETAPVGVSYVARKLFAFDEDTTYLCPAPLYHAAGLKFVMATTALGGTAIIMDRFDAEAYLAMVETYAATHSQVVPTMMLRMMRLDDQVREKFATSSLRYFIHSAAPCPRDLKERIIDWLGPVVYEYYAGTESNGVVFCNTEEWLAHPGTVGRPVGCEIHISDDSGEELPTGETGGVYFASGGDFEYHGDAEKTASSRTSRGWTTLGDIGYVDEDGFLYLTDRKAFMIISGGVNIYPQECENLLATHPQVFEVAVFGVPNPDFGEEVKAVVQPTTMPEDEAGRIELADQLIEFCRSRLADVKCPRTLELRADVPRDPSGKLLKHKLRAEYLAAAHGAS